MKPHFEIIVLKVSIPLYKALFKCSYMCLVVKKFQINYVLCRVFQRAQQRRSFTCNSEIDRHTPPKSLKPFSIQTFSSLSHCSVYGLWRVFELAPLAYGLNLLFAFPSQNHKSVGMRKPTEDLDRSAGSTQKGSHGGEGPWPRGIRWKLQEATPAQSSWYTAVRYILFFRLHFNFHFY